MMTIDKAKFRKPVVPGDQVRFHMTRIAKKPKHVVVPGRGESGWRAGLRSRSVRDAGA